MSGPLTDFDWRIRAAVYRHFIATGAAPAPEDLTDDGAAADVEAAAASLRRLAAAHQLVLWPHTTEIWMAHPFSGVETDYAVSAGGRRWFANCAWDALGIPALLGLEESETRAECSDCGRHVRFGLRAGRPFARPAGAVVHFAVPPRRFWDDIGFT